MTSDQSPTDTQAAPLTDGQATLLAAALEHGYFEVPRGITLNDLADDLDCSHQALSGRMRRALGNLVDTALAGGPEPDTGLWTGWG
ncbi:helix-turn-helix domain-containing protein [Natrinema amylolyticum]|uniref:helix-turn-helix domain-containing protein n=1 Tax=Natrinema amylolyticum TaxID=2878679 RepID=UPI003CCD92F6